MKGIFKIIKNILWPVNCAVCGQISEGSQSTGVCCSCKSKIVIINAIGCRFCGKPLKENGNLCKNCREFESYTDNIYTAAYYKEGIREIIKKFKYKNKTYLVNYLGKLILELYREYKENISSGAGDKNVIVYMPMHKSKKRDRGYNQAELLATYLADKTGLKSKKNYIKRVKKTVPQYKLSRRERFNNLKNSFKASKKVEGKNIVFVDDIATTGASIQNAARELKEKGAASVEVFVLAHGK